MTQPRSIRAAWALLVVIGILALANALIGLAVRRQFYPGVDDYLAAGAPDGLRMITELSSALSYNVIGGLTAAIAVAPLAVALRKPRPWARSATAVGLGIHVLGLMVFLAADPAFYAEPGRDASSVGRPLWDNLVPDWYGPSFYILEILTLALCVAAAFLFYRRSGGDYFADGVRGARDPLGVRPDMPQRVATHGA
ncbi:MAG TPA: hypothetical protein VK659_32565 [Asanoa sp.]|nr:hypothetical protein [Asanoa sp.]